MQSHVEPKHFLVKTEDSPDDIDGPGGPDDYAGSLNRQGDYAGGPVDYAGSLNRQAGNGTGDAAGNAAGNGTGAVATWAEWGEWSGCDANQTRFLSRFRNCINASADACNGEPSEMAPCSANSTEVGIWGNLTGTGDYPCRPNIDLNYQDFTGCISRCEEVACAGSSEQQARRILSDCQSRRDYYDNFVKENGVCYGVCSSSSFEHERLHCTNNTNGQIEG